MTRVAAKLTYRDYLLLPDDGKRYEVMEGDLYMTPAPSPRHQLLVTRLAYALMQYLEHHPVGTVFAAPCDVILSDTEILQPDLVLIRVGGRAVVTDRAIQGAPDLVIEVLSPGTASRDRELKRKRYAHFGVPEYWLVDPELNAVEVLRLENGEYRRYGVFAGSGRLDSPLFPDLDIAVDWLCR